MSSFDWRAFLPITHQVVFFTLTLQKWSWDQYVFHPRNMNFSVLKHYSHLMNMLHLTSIMCEPLLRISTQSWSFNMTLCVWLNLRLTNQAVDLLWYLYTALSKDTQAHKPMFNLSWWLNFGLSSHSVFFPQFLIYNTQLLIGNRELAISPEEYIFGALSLYTDIVQIFLFILQISGAANE